VSTPNKRPRKLEQPEVVWALLNALRRGEPLAAALRTAGVGQSTFYRERRQSPLLRGLIEQAEAAGREQRALSPGPAALPSIEPTPTRPRPLERPNISGLLERMATTTPVSREVVVTLEPPKVEPRAPLAERAAERTRSTLASLAYTLTSSSRASAKDRRDSVHFRPHAEERPGGSHWLPPQLALVLQLVVAVVLVGNVSLPLGIAAVSIAYLLAFRRSDAATARQPQPVVAAPPIDAPVDASHDLRWLDATLARRPPITKGK
jgi:hypothetical protein